METEEQFKVITGYLASSRWVWTTGDPCHKEKQTVIYYMPMAYWNTPCQVVICYLFILGDMSYGLLYVNKGEIRTQRACVIIFAKETEMKMGTKKKGLRQVGME